jgi:hypothetical protein
VDSDLSISVRSVLVDFLIRYPQVAARTSRMRAGAYRFFVNEMRT